VKIFSGTQLLVDFIKPNGLFIFVFGINTFVVSIVMKILLFRVSVAIEPNCSLLTVYFHQLFDI